MRRILPAHAGDWLDIGQAKESQVLTHCRPNKNLLYTAIPILREEDIDPILICCLGNILRC